MDQIEVLLLFNVCCGIKFTQRYSFPAHTDMVRTARCVFRNYCLGGELTLFEQVGKQVFEQARRLLDAEGREGDAVAVQVSVHCVRVIA